MSDLRLSEYSPCIDAGNNGVPDLPIADIEGNIRILDGNGDFIPTVDMGAYEFCQIQLYRPNGGEKFIAGSTYSITWKPKDGITHVKLEYSVDNGINWYEITITENTGSYSWETPLVGCVFSAIPFQMIPGEVVQVA